MMKMTNKINIIQSTMMAVMILGSTSAFAASQMMPEMKSGWEACGGIAKAGMNDCAVKTSLHSCVGLAKTDGQPDSYIFLPKGECGRIVNGKVLAITKQDVANVKAMMMKKMMK